MAAITELSYVFSARKILDLLGAFLEDPRFLDGPNRILLTGNLPYESMFDGTRSPVVDGNKFQLVCPPGATLNNKFSDTYLSGVYSSLEWLAAQKAMSISRVRLIRLGAEAAYSYHLNATTTHLHIPLITNDDCFLIIDGVVEKMPSAGHLYEITTDKLHTEVNVSMDNRIHLVADLVPLPETEPPEYSNSMDTIPTATS